MSSLLADVALLPDGWARDVRLDVSADGTLEAVIPASGDRNDVEAERIRGVALPGLPNLHSHAFQRGMAGLAEHGSAEADSFWSWRATMYRFLEEIGPEELEAIAGQLFVEMLKAGYTSVAEFHYLHRDPGGAAYGDPAETSLRLFRAARRAGLGCTLLPCLYTSGGFGGRPPEEGQRRFLLPVSELLALVGRLRGEAGGDPLLRVGLALHSLRAVTPAGLAEAVEGVREEDPEAPIHVHAAEQVTEVEGCLAWSGARPVEWLLDHAPVDRRWCLVHATHVTGEEVERLARSGAVAGLCPTTEANLGDGLFPLHEHLGLGGRFGIGSDSHVCVSPSEELRWLEYGQRLRRGSRNVASDGQDASTGARLYRGALEGGASALAQPVGRLAPGARADLVVLDPEHPILAGRRGDAVLDSWMVSGDRNPVRDVMVAGRWRVRDGRHPEERAVAERYRAVAERLAREL